MTGFAEFIAESYYSTVDLTWEISGSKRAVAAFSVESISVQVLFEQQEADAAWRVSFDVKPGEVVQAVHSAFHIFNGVFQAVREFLEVRQPELVVFATKRNALANIYQVYLRREQAEIERLGYRLEALQQIERYQEFAIGRTLPAKWVTS